MLSIHLLDAQMVAMKVGQIDFMQDLIRPADIEDLNANGFTVLQSDASSSMKHTAFNIGFVGFNLMRPYLSDVNLRHALFHAYNHEEIVRSIYRFTATPIHSLVPPSQGTWMNPNVDSHSFKPGNVGDPSLSNSTFSIMVYGGYTYVGGGYGDPNGYWMRDGVRLPQWTFWFPPYELEHATRILDEWRKCGFNNIVGVPMNYTAIINNVYSPVWGPNFDMYMMFKRLDRFPLQLYTMCDSSQYVPGADNAVGLNDAVLDNLVRTVKYSLNRTQAVEAAWAAQERLYDPQYPQALPYMMLCSRFDYSAARSELLGNVNSLGIGAENVWTWLNWRWGTADGMRPGTGDSTVIYCNGEPTAIPNYLNKTAEYKADIIEPTQDTGLRVDPYTNKDVVWQYSEYPTIIGPITETTPNGVSIVNGMSVTYRIRNDIYWQDGNKFEADDAIFSLNFLRNNQIPRYISVWQDIADIYQVDALTFKVWANNTSPYHVYNWDRGAFLCPPQVWAWLNGQPLLALLSYNLVANTTDTGPWSYPLTAYGPRTCLFGTGPFIFQFYEPVGQYVELRNWDPFNWIPPGGINLGYFLTKDQIATVKTELFHLCGDVNRDGWVWAEDLHDWAVSYGKVAGQPGYDLNADLNQDGIIDIEDGAVLSLFFGKRKEYP